MSKIKSQPLLWGELNLDYKLRFLCVCVCLRCPFLGVDHFKCEMCWRLLRAMVVNKTNTTLYPVQFSSHEAWTSVSLFDEQILVCIRRSVWVLIHLKRYYFMPWITQRDHWHLSCLVLWACVFFLMALPSSHIIPLSLLSFYRIIFLRFSAAFFLLYLAELVVRLSPK